MPDKKASPGIFPFLFRTKKKKCLNRGTGYEINMICEL